MVSFVVENFEHLPGIQMNFLLYLLFSLLKVIIPIFPLGFIRLLAKLIGKMFYYIIPVRKKTAISNLQLAFPGKSKSEINKTVKGCYINVITVIAEFFYMRKLSTSELAKQMKVKNINIFNEKLKQGKGIILISAHYGNWELTAFGVSKLINVPFNVIVKEQTNKRVNEGINKIRTYSGNKMLDMRNSLRGILTVLKNNGIAAMLGDQSAPKENVKVDFFIKGVPTYEGTARIAIKTGAAVLFGVSTRDHDGTYSLEMHEIETSKYKEPTEENIKALTQDHVNLLVEYIKLRPDHWLWFHRRFKNV